MSRLAPLLATALLAMTFAAVGGASTRPPSIPGTTDGLDLALRAGRVTEAQYALERALTFFDRGAVARRFGPIAPPGPRDATLALRDLALRLDELAPDERILAEQLLSRPNDPGPGDYAKYDRSSLPSLETRCTEVCVSWVETGRDAPALTDGDGNGRPDYVDTVIDVMDTVWATEIGELGYRPPKSDASSPDAHPGGPQLDVYLLDLVGKTDGIVGYCATDDPNASDPTYAGLDVSAYCVFDNGYDEYGSDALALLQATAAHEFFHAVQFAYNAGQDRWLLEATATWMEDEVFDDADDNYRYVGRSHVVYPSVPLDLFSPGGSLGLFVYGAYTFFQLLGETHGAGVVRDAIERGDGVPGEPGRHSLIALPEALSARGVDFASFFNVYAAANWWPPAFYDEGSGWTGTAGQLSVPFPKPFRFTATKRVSPQRTMKLDHLSSGYATFVPGSRIPAKARLDVSVDLSGAGPGARATLVTWSRSNLLKVVPIVPSGAGPATATVKGFKRLKHVVLVLSNGSTRVRDCGTDVRLPFTACLGVPVDDGLPFRFRAKLGG